MSTKTKKRAKTSTRYNLCCLSVMLFSYPAAPYRVYVADSKNGVVTGRHENGVVTGRHEVAGFDTRAKAEQWLKRHCRRWKQCDSP